MKSRKILLAGALTASMAGGGLAGALLFTPGVSGAQDATTSTTVAAAPACDGTHRGFRMGGGGHLDDAADALGITEDELLAALRDGKTIAEIAKDEGVALDKVIDALVADATARLDAAVESGRITEDQADARKADLREHITDMVNGEMPAGRMGGRFGQGGRGRGMGGGAGFGGAGFMS